MHHPKGAVGALFAGAFANRVLFASRLPRPPSYKDPSRSVNAALKNKSSLRWTEKVYAKLLRQITGKSSAQSYTLYSKI